MIIIGLTGGIASGKSTVASQFRGLGAAIYDADRAVHGLLAPGGAAVKEVGEAFPAAKKNNHIDRTALAKEVFGNPASLARLEKILHPLVWKEEKLFLQRVRKAGKKIAILEIPLLFETDADTRCDFTVLVGAPSFLQRQRALSRPNIKPAALDAILARQMPHHHKRKWADVEIYTGLGRAQSFRKVKEIIRKLGNLSDIH